MSRACCKFRPNRVSQRLSHEPTRKCARTVATKSHRKRLAHEPSPLPIQATNRLKLVFCAPRRTFTCPNVTTNSVPTVPDRDYPTGPLGNASERSRRSPTRPLRFESQRMNANYDFAPLTKGTPPQFRPRHNASSTTCRSWNADRSRSFQHLTQTGQFKFQRRMRKPASPIFSLE